MTMTPGVRRFALTAHVTCSVGWIGAVLAFLAIAIVAMTSEDDLTVRGAYVVMDRAARLVLLPLAFASLVTGLVMSLGTAWGLFRHYWVVAKLVLNVFATTILLIYMQTFKQMARVAADPNSSLDLVRNPSPVLHASLALLILVAATVLGIYKPPGKTRYGIRQEAERRRRTQSTLLTPSTAARALEATSTPRWIYFSGLVALGVFLLFVMLHLAGSGHRH